MSMNIYLVARPQFELDGFLSFLMASNTTWARSKEATQAEEIIESAGRICYFSFGEHQSPRTNSEYLRNLIEKGHESVLEHANWSFLVTGISRSLSHQLVRHRIGFSFSQLSQQYHDEGAATFMLPSELESCPKAAAAWQLATDTAKTAYRDIVTALEAGPAPSHMDNRELRRAIRSAARSVLPNATETIIFMTANARALRHFLTARGSIIGDREMRQLAAELLKKLKVEAPALFVDFDMEKLPDGSPVVHKATGRRRDSES